MLTLEQASAQLAPFGYTVDSEGLIHSATGPTAAKVTIKGSRYQVHAAPSGLVKAGALLFSGPDLGAFVQKFWYAKRKA